MATLSYEGGAMRRSDGRRFVRGALLVTLLTGLLVPAAVANGAPAPVDSWEAGPGQVPEAGPRTCRSLEQVGRAGGHVCRHAAGESQAACETADGRVVSAAAVTAFEGSWAARALDLQRWLDDGVPFLEALVPHTHNSYNSVAYLPTLSGLDHNQVHSVRDQLRMGMRGIELDVHWAPSAEGDPLQGMRAPVLCHAEEVDFGQFPGAHLGCTAERHLRHGLAEVYDFLTTTGNEDEVVVLYLENHLEADAAAHDAAAAAIAEKLGGLVHRPPAGQPCAEMPMERSRAELRAGGGRVLVVGDCGPGAWGSWVHERGPRWKESGSGPGDDYAPAGCAAVRAAEGYGANFIRHWEDSTWLSAMAGAGGDVTLSETRRMVECGVNFPGFDQLWPGDPRLAALVWSWAPDQPAGPGACAAHGPDARFHADPCGRQRPFACYDAAAAAWRVAGSGPWSKGAGACAAVGARLAVPWNGWENQQLQQAKPPGVGEVWLGLRDRVGDGSWRPDAG
jgi:hypothetical protein